MEKQYEFKEGMKCICLPGFDTSEESGGCGYKEGKIITISYFTYDNQIAWSNNPHEGGIFIKALKPIRPNIFIGVKLNK